MIRNGNRIELEEYYSVQIPHWTSSCFYGTSVPSECVQSEGKMGSERRMFKRGLRSFAVLV